MSMSAALRTFSSSWLLTSASLSFISARNVSSSIRYFARSSLRPTHAPNGVAIAATSADTMIVIISPLIHALLFNAYRGKPGFHVETRASLGGKLIMAVHCRAGVLPEQVFDQRSKRSPLRGRACVSGGLAVGSTTANIAHAYGVGVLPGAMRPGFRQAAPGVDASVTVDHKVVAYAVEAAGAVPLVDLCHGVVLTLGGRSAVQDYFVYLSHGAITQLFR